MKHRNGLALFAALGLLASVVGSSPEAASASTTAGGGGYQRVAAGWSPAQGTVSDGSPAAHAAVASALRTTNETVPFWNSSFDSGGTTYPYFMVGTSPSLPHTTLVRTALIPIDLTFESAGPNVDRHVNGSDRVAAILKSPIFQATMFPATGDTTQFADAVSRAEWSAVIKDVNHYHVLLNTPVVMPAVRITVPAGLGQVANPGDCIPRAEVDSQWWNQVIPGLVQQLGISPQVFPVFVTSDTGAGLEAGFHGAFEAPVSAHKSAIWTYAWASWFDPGWFSVFGLGPEVGADTDVLSHEVTEWVNDPFLNNVVPPWSFSAPPIIFNACSNLLEAGDPLEETPFAVSLHGSTYHLQDEAFFSYFARQSPSIGYQGKYSFLGTLTTYSRPCSPP